MYVSMFIMICCLTSATASNMNTGVKYIISNPPKGHESEVQNFTGEWFEVYTPPLKSRYSQVFWHNLGSVSLPQDIRTRFQDKVMAITGWEVDVVRKTNDGETSVPCYQSYNHHYGAQIRSSKARVSDTPGPDYGRGPTEIIEVDEGVGPDWIPQVQSFNEHNGNEARQSFHGLPKGYVQPIWSPATFSMTPMQINTLNPDGSGKRGGPLPFSSKAPPNAPYSGILECPCTTRVKKTFGGHITRTSGECGKKMLVTPDDPWDHHNDPYILNDFPVNTSKECYNAAATLFGGGVGKIVNYFGKTYDPKNLRNDFEGQVGYEFTTVVAFDIVALGRAFYNGKKLVEDVMVTVWEADTKRIVVNASVGPSSQSLISGSYSYTLLKVPVTLQAKKLYRITQFCTKNMKDRWNDVTDDSAQTSAVATFGQGVYANQGSSSSVYPSNTDGQHRRPGMVTFFIPGGGSSKNITVSDDKWPSGCSVIPLRGSAYEAIFNQNKMSSVTCGASGKAHSTGHAEDLVVLDLDIDESTDKVTITLKGENGKWFGIGFGATAMSDLPYAIVVDGYGNVTERKLGNHEAGKEIKPTVEIISNAVVSGKRTVVLTRTLKGATTDYYTFNVSVSTIHFINALGGTAHLAQHVNDSTSSISLVEAGSINCICRKEGGTINGRALPPCMEWPLSDLKKNNNPACDVSSYAGGLMCCKDGTFLLDSNQTIPEHEDTVYYKWRFYFEDWDPTKHIQAVHLEWALNGCDSGGGHMGCKTIDYDVPQCIPGTPPEKCVHTVTSYFTGADMLTKCNPKTQAYCADPRNVTSEGVAFIMAGGHCHAPACLSLELYNNDTGELICHISPKMGDGDKAFDENGYIWLPHCAWGNPTDGLKSPVKFKPETTFFSIKKVNNTYYHPGVMAIWQMRGAFTTFHNSTII